MLLNLIPELTDNIYFQSVWANKQGKYFIDGKVLKESLIEKSKTISEKVKFTEKIKSFIPSKKMKDKEELILNSFVQENLKKLKGAIKQ